MHTKFVKLNLGTNNLTPAWVYLEDFWVQAHILNKRISVIKPLKILKSRTNFNWKPKNY